MSVSAGSDASPRDVKPMYVAAWLLCALFCLYQYAARSAPGVMWVIGALVMLAAALAAVYLPESAVAILLSLAMRETGAAGEAAAGRVAALPRTQ